MNPTAPLLEAFAAGLGALLVAMVLLWLLSLRLRDASIVDPFWGLGFVGVAWLYRAWGPPAEPRQLLLLALVTVWGLRLSLHLLRRNWGHGEDRRYAAMRERHGPRFRWVSLGTVFLLQGALIALLSLPFLVVEVSAVSGGWRWSDFVGLLLWLAGFGFEAVGDFQLARFKADPENRGKVMRSGLWALTRHPNYFGDALLWWGFYVVALGAPGGVWTLPCPLLMTFLLMRVSGVTLLERDIAERRPGYREYVATTNAFFPGPRRGS